jgi:hypothetical protein
MVRARETLLSKRLNDRIVDELRKNVRAGIPWRQPEKVEGEERGYADLIYLTTGRFYPIIDFIRGKDDRETIFALWEALREDILEQHAKHGEPDSMPWAWSNLEDR